MSKGLNSYLELRNSSDISPVLVSYRNCKMKFGEYYKANNIGMTEEIHLSKNRWRFDLAVDHQQDIRREHVKAELLSEKKLLLFEGKNIWQFTDMWPTQIQYVIPFEKQKGKEKRVFAAQFFRLAFRTIASSTNERTSIFCILTPGSLCSHSLMPESVPHLRLYYSILVIQAVSNSYTFDWLLRLSVSENITFHFLDMVPFPKIEDILIFLSHASLRLTCNHLGYAPLWTEQLGPTTWREPSTHPPFSWPVLQTDDERWEVRSAIDAVVADAYGLDRSQYEHVLSTFSHSSYKNAPVLCLAKFDELKSIGLEAFTKKYDPYWDIPLNENLPKPVIELPGVGGESAGSREAAAAAGRPFELVMSNEAPVKRRGRKIS